MRLSFPLAAAVLVLGLLATPAAAQPAPEVAVRGAVAIDAGRRHTCAVLDTGYVRCWGDNASGQLGEGTTGPHNNAVQVSNRTNTGPLTGVADVALGADSSCALLRSGEVRCWGKNDQGQLGDGTTNPSSLPVIVTKVGGAHLTGVVALASGDEHVCAVLRSHQVRCWGDNDFGQLGRPGADRRRATTVFNSAGTVPQPAVEAAAGDWHSCVRTPGGQVRCWGLNTLGQLGDGSTNPSSAPVAVSNAAGTGHLTHVTQIAGMVYGTCARLSDGRGRCWGLNDQAQLGDGTSTTPRLRPRLIVGAGGTGALGGIRLLAGGNLHGCAVVAGATARCWGYAVSGSIGNDSYASPQLTPATVVNRTATGSLTGVTDLTAGDFHSCAIAAGTALCWGSNAYNQMGNPSGGGARPTLVVAN